MRRWVDSDEPISGVARDGLLLKLFFGGYGDRDSLRAQVEERKRAAEQKLAELEEIDRTIDTDEDFFPYLTLVHGLRLSRATIAWADDVLALLDPTPATRKRRAPT